jgi:hypothetical protein
MIDYASRDSHSLRRSLVPEPRDARAREPPSSTWGYPLVHRTWPGLNLDEPAPACVAAFGLI